jgi:hypothetical protein
MTLTASQLDTIKRFGGDAAKDDPSSPEAIDAAIATVQANYSNKLLRQEVAGRMISDLRAAKREIRNRPEGRTN